ncbi:MAG: sugar ABC transporter ATP-binding protein [Lachnospiraceae bacterium]|nr:sugar ABC transporter ATP-binding protein [Lachnospiraceae bacterium]
MSLLEMRDIRKSFSGVSVLKGVQLTVESGEVHALLGENGAGKSTLMNILTGVLPRDGGTITFDGQKLEHITITQSEKLGIAFVHQELNLFNDLKVFENMFLNREYANKFGRLDKKRMRAEARELFERLGVEIDPDAVVADLKTSQKQLLEICKALHLHAKLIILDEPTTSLNNEEVDHLFSILRKLKAEGTSFIFISHKMPEIFALADRYTVFRNGEYIGEGRIDETTPEKVTIMMVGESYSNAEVYEKRALGDEVLRLDHFTGDGFHDISLSVKRGEIVGMTGLQGSGSSEMLQAIFGSSRATAGTVTAFGRTVPHNSIHGAMKAGIAMLPNNRKENSVLPDMTLMENMAISEQTLTAAKLPVDSKRDKKRYGEYKEMLGIKAQSSDDLITSLSGGNQQKIFIARWLNTDAELLILDNPTQGIDVGAKAEIYRLILELAKAGKTILINTLEIPEIMKVADRCIVFYDGGMIRELAHEEINEQDVMLYSVGITEKTAGKESKKS